MNRQKKKQRGITLIALVISIIVMLILAGVSLNVTIGENGILSKARLATLMNKFASYKEQLELNTVEDVGVYASGQLIKNYIPNIEDLDIEKFIIMKRNLMYLENDELEIQACKNVGIQTADTGEGGTSTAISEVKAVISGIVDLASKDGENFRIPEDDFDTTTNTNDTSVGLVGIRLYDRSSLNLINKNWNIVIEYNNNNQETARYGSGYYWIKKGETYIIDGESKKFENDFIVDYANKQYYVLSERAVNWNDGSTIAVSDDLVMNVDPVSLADGEWKQNSTTTDYYDFYVKDARTGRESNTGIQKTGDITYEASNKSLKLNEDETNNPDGIGGYLRLYKSGLDFSNGFTFELYGYPTRQFQKIGTTMSGIGNLMGIFCKSDEKSGNPGKVLRFCYGKASGFLGDFCNNSVWTGTGWNVKNIGEGDLYWTGEGDFITSGKEFYLTCVYKRNFTEDDEDYVFATTNNLDKVLFYVNGELKGYTYYSKSSYEIGMNQWNNDSCPFQIGRTPVWSAINFFYFKGNVYTTRLYTMDMTPKQVKDNYDTTLKYRSSF